MTTKSYIIYKDIAVGANDDATLTATGITSNSDATLLLDGAVEYPCISLELNRWIGDGSFSFIEDVENLPVAFESAELSGADGTFSHPPTLTAVLGNTYSSSGITLVTGTELNTELNVKWYRDNVLKYEGNYLGPVAQHEVDDYNKLVVTVTKTLPYRRVRAYELVFGINHRIDKGELRSISVKNECDVKSESLPASTLDWQLDSESSPTFMFQALQPVYVYHEQTLIGVYYVKTHSRVAQTLYNVSCEDAIGVLDRSNFAGGVYNNVSAASIARSIIGETFELDIQCDDVMLTGIIKPSTRRDALQQVAFAWGVCLSTDGTEKIRVFKPKIGYKSIPASRTFYGVRLNMESAISSVTVVSHEYTPDENGPIEILGVKYSDTETPYTKENPKYDRNVLENAIEIKDATLISADNAADTLNRIFEYEMMRANMSAEFVWEGETLGDYITQYTPWNTMASGYIKSLKIKLSNTVVVESESLSMGGEALVSANSYYSGEVESGEI